MYGIHTGCSKQQNSRRARNFIGRSGKGDKQWELCWGPLIPGGLEDCVYMQDCTWGEEGSEDPSRLLAKCGFVNAESKNQRGLINTLYFESIYQATCRLISKSSRFTCSSVKAIIWPFTGWFLSYPDPGPLSNQAWK